MEKLERLRCDFEENAKLLTHPLDFAEYQRLRERRDVILRQARALGQQLKMTDPQWFDARSNISVR
jgi:hypothetical protein